jgi:hypothetical protein
MPRKVIQYDHDGGKPWQTFLDRLSNFTCDKRGNKVNLENYDDVQILGYFISELKNKLNQDFTQTLTYEGEALRHPQMRILRNIIVALHQPDKKDPYYQKLELMPKKDQWNRLKVKAYIDWSIKRTPRSIFSLNYLTREKDINAFLKQFGNVDRSTELPKELKEILPSYIETYGDLSFMSCRPELFTQQIENKVLELGIDLCRII